jgi:predicted nucleic acid-binding protein
VAERPAVNASPLILLAGAGQLPLLRVAGDEIVVPAAVAREIRRAGPVDPAVRALSETPWLVEVPDPALPPSLLAWDLGPGESAVLAWAAAAPGTEAIVDDLSARRCAAAMGIPARGTLGIVLVARKRWLVPAARPILEEMRRAGMYLSDRVLDRALALVGE